MNYRTIMVSFEHQAVMYAGVALEEGVDYSVITPKKDGLPDVYYFENSNLDPEDQPRIVVSGTASFSKGISVPSNFLLIEAAS